MSEQPPVYLALDVWQALGLGMREFDGYYERNGWADTWSNVLHQVRVRAGAQPCLELTDDGEPCTLLVHATGPHYGQSDVGSSEPLPLNHQEDGR